MRSTTCASNGDTVPGTDRSPVANQPDERKWALSSGREGARVLTPPARAAGRGSLVVSRVRELSAITSLQSREPLRMLAPRARGPSVWVYLASYGGGLVSGDHTRLDIHLESATRAFVGSQSTAKIYRHLGDQSCGHHTSALLDREALLVFAPDLVQAYAGARYEQHQTFRLATGASLVLVDGFSSGRAARGERWAFDHFSTRTEVWQQDRRCVWDALQLDPRHGRLAAPSRMGRWNAFATVLFVGPAVQELASLWAAELADQPPAPDADLRVSGSVIGAGWIFRLVARAPERLGTEIRRRLASLAVALGDDPWSRKG